MHIIKISLKVLGVICLAALAGILILAYTQKREFKSRAESLKSSQKVIDTSSWLTYKHRETGWSMKYPPDWKYEEDVMNCPVVFYNEKYPKRLPQGMDIDRNASISFCLTNTFLTPYSASQFIERFTGDKETILIGSSNVGVFSESPGLFLASFINWRDLYNLTMIPLVWNNEQGVREGFNDTERAELREVFMAIASTIEN